MRRHLVAGIQHVLEVFVLQLKYRNSPHIQIGTCLPRSERKQSQKRGLDGVRVENVPINKTSANSNRNFVYL